MGTEGKANIDIHIYIYTLAVQTSAALAFPYFVAFPAQPAAFLLFYLFLSAAPSLK